MLARFAAAFVFSSVFLSTAAFAQRMIQFAGYPWQVKSCTSPCGPGPNLFSDAEERLWVDAAGLHLTISQDAGTWYSTEVILQANLGYGTYAFHTRGRLDTIDRCAVAGLFTWDDFAPPNYREIDFEFSRWCNAADPTNAQYVVQPFGTPGNLQRYTANLTDADSDLTLLMEWQPGRVRFWTYRGHHDLPFVPPASDLVFAWGNNSADVPTPGTENVRINFWLFNATPPLAAGPLEMLVTDFQFVAEPQRVVRVATWNIETAGVPASLEYDAAVGVLRRIGADVVAVNEIASAADAGYFAQLATDAGYASAFEAGGSPFGSDRNGFMTSLPALAQAVNTSAALSGDAMANDVTRYLVETKLALPAGARDLTLVSAHWKSGTANADEFRRAVDSIRIAQALSDLSSAGDAFIALGDINEEIFNVPQTPNPFTALPSGLPLSFALGMDLAALLPSPGIVNDPFFHLAGLAALDAFQLDGGIATRPTSGRRLDYLFLSNLLDQQAATGEVYDSLDEGLGGGRFKFGAAPGATASADASDHLPVFADFVVPLASCGNGSVDFGETCDNGGLGGGDGCDGDCQAESGYCCAGAPSNCVDTTTCSEPAKSILTIRDKVGSSKDLLNWKWLKGTAASADFGDPAAGATAYTLCLFDDGVRVGSLSVGAGGTCDTRPCWSATSSGFKYHNRDANPEGVTGVGLKAGTGTAKIRFKAAADNLDLPGPAGLAAYFKQTSSVQLALVRSDAAACWKSTFTAARKNQVEAFKAVAP